MPKAFALLGLIVSICLLLVFGGYLAAGFPFKTLSKTMDIGFVVCGVILAYLSWTTFRELR